MKTSNNTILVTGGTSGIGFELAKQLLTLGNTVIVTGREASKLDETKRKLPMVHTVQSDVSDPKAIARLFDQVTKDFPTRLYRALVVYIGNPGGSLRGLQISKFGIWRPFFFPALRS